MKVLVNMNHGANRSYVIDFGGSVDKETLMRILKGDRDDVVRVLLGYAYFVKSIKKIEVSIRERMKAEASADYTINGSGFTALA